jgi:hypothetical protein
MELFMYFYFFSALDGTTEEEKTSRFALLWGRNRQEPLKTFHKEYNRFMTQASVARHGQRGCSVVRVRIEV